LIDFDFTTEKKDIRLFARIVPAVLVIWGTVFGFAHQWSGNSEWILYGIAVALFFWGMFSPYTLRPVYTGWMYFSRVVAFLLTTVVLGLVFYVGVTGVGLLMRLLGKNPLDRKIDRSAPSYWIRHGPYKFNPQHYERQF
jgi:hypothetical protein